MGACLSKKKGSSGSNSISTAPPQPKNSENVVTVTMSKPEVVSPKDKKLDTEIAKEDEGQVKKEIFIIKHRKSHDERERNCKIQPCSPQKNLHAKSGDGLSSSEAESMGKNKVAVAVANAIAPSTPNMAVTGVRTSSCTKEEVDAILIQCGRLSRSSSGRAASSSGGRKYSGSKRSFDFDHCDNDAVSAEDDTKRANGSDNSEEYDAAAEGKRHHQHRQRHRQSPRPSSSSQGRRRTPSRERDQNQRSSSRERRVSRSPGRRTSETNTATANASNNNNNTVSRPGKLVSVPATVSSLVMDKSNNGGGGEVKRVAVKRNGGEGGVVGSRGAASPRSQSPARANGRSQSPARANGIAANGKVLGENQQQQQQPSLSRNNSARKAEHSPYRRNPLSEVDPNSLAYPQSNTNVKVQNKPKKEIEPEANQKSKIDMNDTTRNRTSNRVALEKGVGGNCKAKEHHQEEEIKVLPDNAVVKTVIVPSGVDNHKPQTLTRSRSSRRSSRDLDINPEALLNPPLTYTSLLLEDIHNFHQKNTQQQPSVSLPACLTKACSILEAVADLNSTTSSNFSSANHQGKRVADTKDPFVESEVVVSDDVMEPSLHKYVTVKRGGSIDMDDQESSGSNSFSVSSAQQHWGVSSSSWEPSSADSTDCWTSRLNNSRDECQKCPLGLGGSLLSSDMVEGRKKKTLNSERRDCDHQHSGGIGRGRLGSNKGLHNTLPVVTAAAST